MAPLTLVLGMAIALAPSSGPCLSTRDAAAREDVAATPPDPDAPAAAKPDPAQGVPDQSSTTGSTTGAATPPATPAQARVDEFLLELEKTGSTISTLSGALAYEKFDALVEESERRFGRLVLDSKDGRRRFAIYFDEFIDGTGRSDRSVDHWIYADGWLSEQDHRNRSFTRRQIVPPGRDFDPLALGEGPIPIPIGQKRADVLARFEASETDLPQDVPLLATLRNVAGLRLVPRAGTEMARSTEAVELFFDRTTLAPTGVVVREKNGNRTIARISSPVVNGEVKPEDRALLDVPSPDPGAWTIDVRPWKD